MKKLSKENDDFIKKLIFIAGPVILQQVINLSVNLCDGIMVGQLQEAAISGVSIGNQFYMLFHIFCMGLGGGAAVLVNQLWGRKDVANIKQVITLLIRICIVVASFFTILSFFATEQILEIFTKNKSVIDEGTAYLKMMSGAYIIHGLALTLSILYRSVGMVWLSLISSICSFGINIFLNWVFIFGKLGFEPMGVKGAALGTVLARLVEFVVIATFVFILDKRINYKIKYILKSCKNVLSQFRMFAVPVIISDLMLQLGNNMIAITMGHMENSKVMLAANNITAITVQISTFFILGISNAASIMVGHSIGEGNIKKAKKYGVKFLKVSVVVGLFSALVIKIISPFILNAYVVSSQTIEYTNSLVNAISIIVLFQAVSSVLTKGVLRGGGDTKFLMVADVLFLWIASVPLGFLFGIIFNLSPFYVYFAMKIDMIIKAIWCIFRLYNYKWIKKLEN